MTVRVTPVDPLKRQYPHVDDISDWRAQQSVRLLWDRVFNLEERLQAVNATQGDLVEATNSQEDQLAKVQRVAGEALAIAQRASGEAGAGAGGPTASNEFGKIGKGSAPPTVSLPDHTSVVAAYMSANPDEVDHSCNDPSEPGYNDPFSWDFTRGVVAALQAVDPRFGANGKRGNTSDLSVDAVAYYHGASMPPPEGSNDVYVVDIVIGHCGTSPSAGWLDQTNGGIYGAWVSAVP